MDLNVRVRAHSCTPISKPFLSPSGFAVSRSLLLAVGAFLDRKPKKLAWSLTIADGTSFGSEDARIQAFGISICLEATMSQL